MYVPYGLIAKSVLSPSHWKLFPLQLHHVCLHSTPRQPDYQKRNDSPETHKHLGSVAVEFKRHRPISSWYRLTEEKYSMRVSIVTRVATKLISSIHLLDRIDRCRFPSFPEITNMVVHGIVSPCTTRRFPKWGFRGKIYI